MKAFLEERRALVCKKGNSTFYISSRDADETAHESSSLYTEKHSFLQFALLYFRDNERSSKGSNTLGGSLRNRAKLLEYLTGKRSKKDQLEDWTWKEITDKVKYSPCPIGSSLLKLESDYLNQLAVDSFAAIMRYMGDLPLKLHQRETECVYTVLVICHHHPPLRDEIFCQIIKQTTNNKSLNQNSRIRGWQLLSLLIAFFKSSDELMPYLRKYLKSAAEDFRRLEQSIAEICIRNLNQTLQYGGRRNVPSEQEINAVIEGRLMNDHSFYLPGGMQLAVPVSSSSVVGDIVRSICNRMGVDNELEYCEFSLYCIVEGDQYTMPLENDEYVLDLVAELERNENKYYLIFCRSVWNFRLRLDSQLYIEIIFNQIIPDYLEGYLLVSPSNQEQVPENIRSQILRVALLLHRANENSSEPKESDMTYLLPKSVLKAEKDLTSWVSRSHELWEEMTALNKTEAMAQCLELLQGWSLFGSCFFGIKGFENEMEEYILAVNKTGINVLDFETHETLWRFSFAAADSPMNTTDENGITYASIVLGDINFRKTIKLQVDHAHEVMRLVRQYMTIQSSTNEPHSNQQDFPKVIIKV